MDLIILLRRATILTRLASLIFLVGWEYYEDSGQLCQTRAALACQEAALAGGDRRGKNRQAKGALYVMADPGCVGGCLRLSETDSGRQKNEDRLALTNHAHADHVFASSSRTDEEAKPRSDLRASPGFPSQWVRPGHPVFASDFS